MNIDIKAQTFNSCRIRWHPYKTKEHCDWTGFCYTLRIFFVLNRPILLQENEIL